MLHYFFYLLSFMVATKQEYAQICFAETTLWCVRTAVHAVCRVFVYWFVIVSSRCRLPVICQCHRDCCCTGMVCVFCWRGLWGIFHRDIEVAGNVFYATGLCYNDSVSPDYASIMLVWQVGRKIRIMLLLYQVQVMPARKTQAYSQHSFFLRSYP